MWYVWGGGATLVVTMRMPTAFRAKPLSILKAIFNYLTVKSNTFTRSYVGTSSGCDC